MQVNSDDYSYLAFGLVMPVKGIEATFVYDFGSSNQQLVKGGLVVEGKSLVQLMGRFKRAGVGMRDGEALLSYKGQELLKWVGSVGSTERKMSIAATLESSLHAPIKIQGERVLP